MSAEKVSTVVIVLLVVDHAVWKVMVIKFVKSSVNTDTNTCSVHFMLSLRHILHSVLTTKPNSAAFWNIFFCIALQTFGFTYVSRLSFVARAQMDFS